MLCDNNTCKTGDGVGILLEILATSFFVEACREAGIVLPKEREYGVGMFFFPQDELKRNQSKKMFEIIVEKEGLNFLGWQCGSDRTGCTRTKSNRLYAIYYAGIRQETGRDRKGH